MEPSSKNSSSDKKRKRSLNHGEQKVKYENSVYITSLNRKNVGKGEKLEKAGIVKFLDTVGCLLLSAGYLITTILFIGLMYGVFQTLSLLWTTGVVTTHDVAGVFNMRRLQQGEGRAFNTIIITTRNFEGSQAEFDAQTLNAVSDPNTIYVAIDVTHRHLAVVGGSKVSLGDSAYHDAVDAFRKNIHGNDYTSATLAVLHSLHDDVLFGNISVIIIFGIMFAICLGGYFILRRLGLLPKGGSDGGSSSSGSSDSSYGSSSSSDSGSDSGGGHGGFASGNF